MNRMACALTWYTSQYIRTVLAILYSLALVHLIPTWVVWAEISVAVLVALPKWSINQFKLVQLSKKQALRAYCRHIYVKWYTFSFAIQ